MKIVLLSLVSLVAALSLPLIAIAGPTTYSFSQDEYAASATFNADGGQLSITLTNTSTYDVMQPDQL